MRAAEPDRDTVGPMAVTVKIPRLGVAMEEGTLTSWLVDDGAVVSVGQPLYTLETDKVEQEIESPAEGILRHLVETGETLAVGTPVAEIG
jgi:pyruvate/2-oxoglutarate dehydrogenase complex dihydrolipoamide acyltransferase (E2) component